MRPVYRLASLCLGAGLLLGCQNKPKLPPPAPPADQQTLSSIRQIYQRVDPTARVGLVTAVDPKVNLAAVSEMPVQEFKEGFAVTFIDSQQKVIGHGKVVAITDDSLHVRYDAPPPTDPRAPKASRQRDPQTGDRRTPQVGDLVVRVN